jgi:hypothetical protein
MSESRWLNETQYKNKQLLFPTQHFCNYRPPPPENDLKCSDVIVEPDLDYWLSIVPKPTTTPDMSLWPESTDKLEDNSAPPKRCQKCNDIELRFPKRNYRGIPIEFYMEFLRLGVKVCPYSLGRESVCGAPANGYCDKHKDKTDDKSKDIIASYREIDYD